MFEEKINEMNMQTEIDNKLITYEKRVYTIDEIMDILCIGKNAAYNLVNSGVFHYVKVGGHYRISKKSFDKWLDKLDEEPETCQVCD